MNKYHFLWVIERLLTKNKGPRIEHVAIPATLFLGLLIALLPADFRDFAGLEGEVWQSIVVIMTMLSCLATIVVFAWWIIGLVRNPRQSPEEVVEQVITQMAEDRKRLPSIQQPQAPDMEGAQN